MLIRSFITFALIIGLSLSWLISDVQANDTATASRRASEHLLNRQDSTGKIDSLGITGWATQALAANNLLNDQTVSYLVLNSSKLESATATDLERTILALVAGKQNPYSVNGLNLIQLLEAKHNNSQIGSIDQLNDDIFAILAFLASDVPTNNPALIDAVNFIASQQQIDGSWGWNRTGQGDSNSTAMAVTALKLAEKNGLVVTWQQAKAIKFLQSTQAKNGGFGYYPNQTADAASTSWVIGAILALDELPENWQLNGRNPYDYLHLVQTANGGVKWQENESAPDSLTTAYAAIALAKQSIPVIKYRRLATPSPTPIPTPSPSHKPTPSPTQSPSPTPSFILFASPTPTPSLSPTASPTPTVKPSPSPSANPSPNPSPNPTPSPSPSANATANENNNQPNSPVSPTPLPKVNNSSQSKTNNQLVLANESETIDTTEATFTIEQAGVENDLKSKIENKIEEIIKLPAKLTQKSPSVAPTPIKLESPSPIQAENLNQAKVLSANNQSPNQQPSTLIIALVMVLTGISLITWGFSRVWLNRRL